MSVNVQYNIFIINILHIIGIHRFTQYYRTPIAKAPDQVLTFIIIFFTHKLNRTLVIWVNGIILFR